MDKNNPDLYPFVPYDPEASDAKRIAWLEERIEDLQFRDRFCSNALENMSEWAHEIGRSCPMVSERTDRVKSLASYWRWVMCEDCMADVPDKIERCLQAVIAGLVFGNGY